MDIAALILVVLAPSLGVLAMGVLLAVVRVHRERRTEGLRAGGDASRAASSPAQSMDRPAMRLTPAQSAERVAPPPALD